MPEYVYESDLEDDDIVTFGGEEVYQSDDESSLATFFTKIHVEDPESAEDIKTVIIDPDFDDVSTSNLLDTIYSNDWITDDNDQSEKHVFRCVRDWVRQETGRDTLEAAMSDPYLYANVVAVLLVICSELRTLFIPRAWQYDFPIAVFEQWCEVILTDNFEF